MRFNPQDTVESSPTHPCNREWKVGGKAVIDHDSGMRVQPSLLLRHPDGCCRDHGESRPCLRVRCLFQKKRGRHETLDMRTCTPLDRSSDSESNKDSVLGFSMYNRGPVVWYPRQVLRQGHCRIRWCRGESHGICRRLYFCWPSILPMPSF